MRAIFQYGLNIDAAKTNFQSLNLLITYSLFLIEATTFGTFHEIQCIRIHHIEVLGRKLSYELYMSTRFNLIFI